MAKKGLWRGLATFMASLTALSMAGQVTTNNWASKINSMLNTNNYVTTTNGDEPASMGDHFRSEFASLADMQKVQRDISVQIGAEGMVLLKNENSALPMDKGSEKVTL